MPSIKDFMCGGERRVPRGPLPSMSPLEAWRKQPHSGLRVTWLGHSTMLIEIDGARILTDPVWGPRASPSALIGPKRFQPVPVSLREMPPVDVVIVSHDHYDHLDYPTIRALAKTKVPFVTSLGVGAHLEYWGVQPERITELDWWGSHAVANTNVVLTAAPSQHFSGRGLKDRNATLWSSFAIRSPNHSVFFSGDTGLTTEYRSIRERLGPFDLVMLEVGAFYPAWGDIHLGPDNALKAHAMLGGVFMPVHWGTFSLAMHAWDQPAERLLELAPQTDAQLLMPLLGQPVEPVHADVVTPWWREVDATPGRAAAETEGEVALPSSAPWPLD
jgi:L-ascorbate metabolism protein UlaG (beta-lactamase superfamily)